MGVQIIEDQSCSNVVNVIQEDVERVCKISIFDVKHLCNRCPCILMNLIYLFATDNIP